MEPEDEFRKVTPDRMIPVSEIDIKGLAEIYDERDVYLSIYLPSSSREEVDRNSSYLASRFRAIGKAIPEGLRDDFQKSWEVAMEHADNAPVQHEKGRILFVSSPLSFVHVYRIGVEPERMAVLDTSPFLLPLAKLRDDFLDYGILLMDSQQARFFMIESDRIELVDRSKIDLMNKHKKGGMSQRRFNRLRRGAINSFVKDVLEDLRGIPDLDSLRGIVIAGPGEAKKKLMEDLPVEIASKVFGVVDLDMDISAGDLVRIGNELAVKDEFKKSTALAETLRAAVMKGEPAAYGVMDIRNALNEGRVDSLIILDNASVPGWICERCQNIQERSKPPEKCPLCGGPTSIVDVIEELYELAQRTGANVEFIDEHAFLESIGGIGAILRY
ncbi:MAG: Vms1/Ankzf1 family peptidyl-tRNA hydrolase [Thermoplasmatota archaeon]